MGTNVTERLIPLTSEETINKFNGTLHKARLLGVTVEQSAENQLALIYDMNGRLRRNFSSIYANDEGKVIHKHLDYEFVIYHEYFNFNGMISHSTEPKLKEGYFQTVNNYYQGIEGTYYGVITYEGSTVVEPKYDWIIDIGNQFLLCAKKDNREQDVYTYEGRLYCTVKGSLADYGIGKVIKQTPTEDDEPRYFLWLYRDSWDPDKQTGEIGLYMAYKNEFYYILDKDEKTVVDITDKKVRVIGHDNDADVFGPEEIDEIAVKQDGTDNGERPLHGLWIGVGVREEDQTP